MKQIPLLPLGNLFVTPRELPKAYQHLSDFSVIIVGSGCPISAIGRSHPSALVQYQGKYFLVDIGEGTCRRLAEGGIDTGKIENVLFTHHHADHDAGYPYFMLESWKQGRRRLNLVGPPKTKLQHEKFTAFYAEDLQTIHPELDPNTTIQEYEDKSKFSLDGVEISSAKLTHIEHNLGLRFQVGDKSIVISGDTSYDPALVALAKDADILVMDSGPMPTLGFLGVGNPPPKKAKLGSNAPDVENAFEKPPHPLEGEVSRIAIEAGVKTLVITHYFPVAVDEEATLAMMREEGFQGNLVFGRDLLEIAL